MSGSGSEPTATIRPRPSADDGQSTADGGQSTAEFVLVLPVVFMLLAGLVQVAVLARDHVLVWSAAREAGREAAVGDNGSAVRSAALRAAPGLAAGRLSVTVSGGSSTGDLITVVVDYRSAKLVPLVPLRSSLDHRATATYRKE